MRATWRVVLILIALGCAAYALSACKGMASDTHAKVCEKVATKTRAADEDCDGGEDGFRWRYYDPGVIIPKVGGKLPTGEYKGTTKEPSGSVVRIPPEGGTAGETERKER